MRKASDVDDFPYMMKTICYFSVDKTGEVTQLPHANASDRLRFSEAYKQTVSQDATLYAVWPGKWTSDLFIIDDLDAFSSAFKFV